ncbi:hypothetical protein [Pedobacter jamesrossensis]|uniref:Uncharacterized protein n=1 Tax=Pedobacter jamesrossensis TaxID=1908238 RepID=A0ABV8NK57_9SPHI
MGKIKNRKLPLPNALVELKGQLLKMQSRISAWLNWHCRNLSAKALLAMLIAFCTICSAYLLWLILGRN